MVDCNIMTKDISYMPRLASVDTKCKLCFALLIPQVEELVATNAFRRDFPPGVTFLYPRFN